ncbi:hypothetical protein MYRNA_116 [Mycobacterium phage Myrna]|uniref:Uncharacterized protein n=1 Tax=Mycobacterium phage Myrna TaxID=546805 RepID=B5LJC0_9CAUD|nr:gp116 [Mycobacterium phage Myrna]ACH62117.1 hypothetical protein MYRNA_116 [Mycobacterium phage Myrna]
MSMYDRPKLTHQIRQFDRNPGKGESILSAVAQPSAAAVVAENNSLQRARETGVDEPRNPRPEVYAHRDYYRNEFDSISIKKRPDLDEGVL